MGLVDLKDYVVAKVKPRPGLGGKISCAVIVVALAFALGTFLGTVVHPGQRDFFRAMEIVTLDPNGMNGTVRPPYPQAYFCPMWEEGSISGIQCYAVHNGAVGHTPLPSKTIDSQYTSKNPANKCIGFNTDGTAFAAWDWTIHCEINSTNTNSKGVSWDGRVRLYLDAPGVSDFQECKYCVSGIDGTLIVQNYHTVAYWQANLFEAVRGRDMNRSLHERVDYKVEYTRLPFNNARPTSSGMTFEGGFYSPAVWTYDRPDVVFKGSSFRGEEFVFRLAGLASLLLVSYYIWACLSSTVILVVVGEEGLSSSSN